MRILLVHGYLANAGVLWPLGRRLAREGHEVEYFTYPSRKGLLARHANALATRIDKQHVPVAVVAHSLGGLLVHRALRTWPHLNVTHRVFIATPHRGCRAVALTSASPLGKVMGRAIQSAVEGEQVPAHPARLGVILGGRDRTVRPDEADLPRVADRLELPYAHNELVWRPRTAAAVHRFIERGWFEEPITARSLGLRE